MCGFAVACTTALSLSAQAPPSSSQAAPANAPRFVAIGCITRDARGGGQSARTGAAAGSFLLRDMRGETPTIYRLEGDEDTLNLHVGHTVEVSGPISAQSASRGRGRGTALVLKVTSLTWISKTCQQGGRRQEVGDRR